MSFIDTAFTEYFTRYNDNLDRNENRMSKFGILAAAIEDGTSGKSVIPEGAREEAQAAYNNTQKMPVQQAFDTTVLTNRAVSINPTSGSSALVTVNYVTKGFDVTINPAEFKNQPISMQAAFNKQIEAGFTKLGKEFESYMIASLDSNLNQQYGGTRVENHYTTVANIIQVTQAQKALFIADMSTILDENDFDGDNMIVLAKTGYKSDIRFAVEQGAGNSTNTSYVVDGKRFFFSNRIENGGGDGEGYFFQEGTFGVITRHDFDAQMGSRTTDGHAWDIETDPITGLTYDVFSYETAEDTSALGGGATTGNTRSKVMKWAFRTDFAIILPYNSNAGTSITDEAVAIAALDVSYDLAHKSISLDGLVVTNTAGSTTYTEGTDYTIDYVDGTIICLSTGTITTGSINIDYIYGNASAVNKYLIKSA